MAFYLPSFFESPSRAFERAVGPLLIAGSLGFAGCTTTSKTTLDMTQCNYKTEFTALLGAADKIYEKTDEEGNTVKATINGLNLRMGKEENFSAGDECGASKGIVRVGVHKDEKGDYDLKRLALLYAVYSHKDTNPALKYMLAERTKLDHGFSPADIPAISKAQWERLNPPKPETFRCEHENGIRRCTTLGEAPAAATPAPQ